MMIGAKSFLIDLDGVLYVDKVPLKGAKESIRYLDENGYSYRFLSNTTSKCRNSLAALLGEMGFDIPKERIFTPSIAAAEHIGSEQDNMCFLLTKEDVKRDFQDAGIPLAEEDADFVVIGDAEDLFTFDHLNRAFRLIMEGAETVALEKDRCVTPDLTLESIAELRDHLHE